MKKLGINLCNRVDPLGSSGVASDPKESKSFLSYEGKSFSRILYKFLYEIEIVTFQKILPIQ